MLGITDIDPLQNDLLFERFLNPERISMPDIDIDFVPLNRRGVMTRVTFLPQVWQRPERRNGHSTQYVGGEGERSRTSDVRWICPYGEVDRIAKLIPAAIGAISPIDGR